MPASFFLGGSEQLSKRFITDTTPPTPNTTWQQYVQSIAKDDSIFQNPLINGSTPFQLAKFLGIEHAANHNLFSGIFDQYLYAYTKLVKDAGSELLKTLGNWDSHQPHYALFLAFLKLFRFAKKRMNSITKRHLDFYYEEVLKLSPKPAIPNKVHLLAELAKQVESYVLTQGTELKGGKDSTGKDVVYALDNDAVFNKAKVAQIKSIYKGASADTIIVSDTTAAQLNKGRLFAAPVTNSDDGNGAALTSVNKEWHPYVHKIYSDASLVQIALPEAQIGFAVASKYLYLVEGTRVVQIRFTHAAVFTNAININGWLTTAKGWYQVKTGYNFNRCRKLC